MAPDPAPLASVRGAPERTAAVDRSGLRERVYDVLLDLILDGVVEAGERLTIDDLAKRLRLSPTPVREALVQLERTGLVTREALKGYRVAPPLDGDQIAELLDARLILEVNAAERAEENSGILLAPLSQAEDRHVIAAEHIIRAADGGATPVALFREYFEADRAFHRVVVEASGNRFLVDLFDDLGAHVHRMREAIGRQRIDVDEALLEHRRIVRAFESGAAGAGADAVRAHIAAIAGRAAAAR